MHKNRKEKIKLSPYVIENVRKKVLTSKDYNNTLWQTDTYGLVIEMVY